MRDSGDEELIADIQRSMRSMRGCGQVVAWVVAVGMTGLGLLALLQALTTGGISEGGLFLLVFLPFSASWLLVLAIRRWRR